MKLNCNQRYKITLEYIGLGFCGWQRQSNSLSLQQIIEEAIFKFSKNEVTVQASGRTDAGVHAYGQVAHFELCTDYDPRKVMSSINHFCHPYPIGVGRNTIEIASCISIPSMVKCINFHLYGQDLKLFHQK